MLWCFSVMLWCFSVMLWCFSVMLWCFCKFGCILWIKFKKISESFSASDFIWQWRHLCSVIVFNGFSNDLFIYLFIYLFGLTVLPWANGRCLVWDFTCPDTLAASHLNRAVVNPGSVANDAEDRKSAKYLTLAPLYKFKPIAVETLGALGESATDFFQILGQRISVATGEPQSSQFLFQRLSVAIQRGNAACVVGTVPGSRGLDDIFYI